MHQARKQYSKGSKKNFIQTSHNKTNDKIITQCFNILPKLKKTIVERIDNSNTNNKKELKKYKNIESKKFEKNSMEEETISFLVVILIMITLVKTTTKIIRTTTTAMITYQITRTLVRVVPIAKI